MKWKKKKRKINIICVYCDSIEGGYSKCYGKMLLLNNCCSLFHVSPSYIWIWIGWCARCYIRSIFAIYFLNYGFFSFFFSFVNSLSIYKTASGVSNIDNYIHIFTLTFRWAHVCFMFITRYLLFIAVRLLKI